MSGQSKFQSKIEATVNMVLGYLVALVSQLILFPLFDIHISLKNNMYIGLWFTLISLIRSYYIRRAFNKFHLWQENQTTNQGEPNVT